MTLTMNQRLVLDAVMNDPGSSLSEIAEETDLSVGRVEQSIRILESHGLVMGLEGLGETEVRFVTLMGALP